jgi:hypothetical protein
LTSLGWGHFFYLTKPDGNRHTTDYRKNVEWRLQLCPASKMDAVALTPEEAETLKGNSAYGSVFDP